MHRGKSSKIEAQVKNTLAIGPPARVPSIDGETKSPPLHSEYAKYCLIRMSRERYIMQEAPLMQKPYLCTSIEIEVTPGTRKSWGGGKKTRRNVATAPHR